MFFHWYTEEKDDEKEDCMEGMGEEKLYFLLLRSVKRQERPLG